MGNRVTNGLYRTSKGRIMGKVRGLRVMLLTVPGRKSGLPRTTAVSYIRDGDSYVVTGSGGGRQAEPQWFRNLRAADRAEIETGPTRIPVSVQIASAAQREVLWRQLLSQAPFFAKYQAKVQREIPMAVLSPIATAEPRSRDGS